MSALSLVLLMTTVCTIKTKESCEWLCVYVFVAESEIVREIRMRVCHGEEMCCAGKEKKSRKCYYSLSE